MKDATIVSTKLLGTTVRSLIDSIDRTWTKVLPLLDNLEEIGYNVWALSLSIAIAAFIVTLILISGLSYGCWQVENRAGTTFIIGATAMSLVAIVLAAFAIVAMLLGGHGEVFLCRPMYDYPQFNVLGKLFDKPGLFYVNRTGNGIINELLHPDGSFSNATKINATLANAINKCEMNGASYKVFDMEGILNISKIVDIKEYPELELALNV